MRRVLGLSLVRSLARSIARLTHSLRPRALQTALIRSLARSLTPELMGKRIVCRSIWYVDFNIISTHCAMDGAFEALDLSSEREKEGGLRRKCCFSDFLTRGMIRNPSLYLSLTRVHRKLGQIKDASEKSTNHGYVGRSGAVGERWEEREEEEEEEEKEKEKEKKKKIKKKKN